MNSGAYIGGGFCNLVQASYSGISAGCNNCITTVANSHACNSFIGAGCGNTINGCFSSILGGSNNTVSGMYSTIIGGQGNNIPAGLNNAAVFGQGITAAASNTFHVNCLNASNLPFIAPGGALPSIPTGSLYYVNCIGATCCPVFIR